MEYHKRPEADIKLRYQFYSELGLALALLFFVVTFIVSKEFHVEVKVREITQQEIEVEDIPTTRQQKTIPRPSRPTFTVAEEDEEIVEDEEILFEDEDDWSTPPPPPPPMAGAEEEIVEFWAIEQQPEMIGGTEALYKAVKYPEMAQRAGMEGLAQIGFVVGPDGRPRDFVVLGEKPEGLGFGEAAIEALKTMTFKPGKQRDKFVAVRMSQVIRFEMTK